MGERVHLRFAEERRADVERALRALGEGIDVQWQDADAGAGDVERRRQIETGVTRALAESRGAEDAGAKVLEALCKALDGDIAVAWIREPGASMVRCLATWCEPRSFLADVACELRQTICSCETELSDMLDQVPAPPVALHRVEPGSPRAQLLDAALGPRHRDVIPIRAGTEVIGIIEVFSGREASDETGLAETFDAAGNQVGQFVERSWAESTLRERELQLRALFENAPDAMFVLDDDRRLLDANPAGSLLVGVPRQELSGCRMTQFAVPDESDEDRPDWFAAILDRGYARGEFDVRRADGEVRRAEYAGRANVQPGRHLVILRDVTSRRHAQEQALRLQKIESVGRLASALGDKFDELLTSILADADHLLSVLAADDESRSHLEAIRMTAQAGEVVTEHLLSFGRRSPSHPVALDLNVVVEGMEKMLRRLVGEDVELRLALGRDLGRIDADPGQLQQAIGNLAVNARDAMASGGMLTIETCNVAIDEGCARWNIGLVPGEYVLLSICDTGSGMSPEVAEHLFEPFFTTKDRGTASGLGLATAYGIITQAGGFILLHTEPGHGTTFKIYFPALGEREPVEEVSVAAWQG